MLNNVNGKIPNNLRSIMNARGFTIADAVRMTGMTRPTVMKLIDGEDSYISKIALLCDSLGVCMSEIYGKNTYHQENHAHGNSKPTMIGYQFNQAENTFLRQRIKDLEELLSAREKIIKLYESREED